MSAFMVTKEHIDALVWTAYRGPAGAGNMWTVPGLGDEDLDFPRLSALGEMLVKENLSSIHSRYPDTIANPENTPGPNEQYWLVEYAFAKPVRQLTALQALKAIQCYEYQACEHPEWDKSDARRFCIEMKDRLISFLPGWDEDDWEVTLKVAS